MATPQIYYFKFLLYCIYFCVCVYGLMCAVACMWSEDNKSEESDLRCSVGLGSGLGEQETLPAELSLRPLILIAF